MKNRFLLTESDRKEIKKLYNISEQESALQRILRLAQGDEEEEEETEEDESDTTTESQSMGSIDSEWMNVTKKIIDKFEGGYWNYWECKNHPYSSVYENSGETMFGLDRKAGDIENSFGSDGKEFFRIIDEKKEELGMKEFCKKWKYNYKAEGSVKERLTELAGKIMKQAYDKYSNLYFKGDTKDRVEGNRGLLLHFAYACWNGPGFFKSFANSINEAIEDGKSDKELIKIAKEDRRNKFSGWWVQAQEKVNSEIENESGFA
jgi:hypothetical protein